MTELRLENYELAAMAGTSRQSIWKLRTGLTRMLPHWAKRLAPHLGISWQELIEGPPSPVDQDRAKWNAVYDALDEEGRRALLTVGIGMVRRADPVKPGPAAPTPQPKERAPPKPPFPEGGNVKENRVSPLLTLVQSRDEAQPQPCSETAEQGD
jgi:hypothetical protein